MLKQVPAIALLLLTAACAASTGAPASPASVAGQGGCAAAANRAIVLAFYTEGLVNRQPRAAFERYAAPDFVEHKPDVEAGTREAVVAYLEGLIASVPEPRWEIVRSIAEGDMVFLHASFSPAPGAPKYAVADIFRLRDCKIVEHWDVVAPPAVAPRNPNSRF